MIESSARIPTAHGRKYLSQLCRHFAHRIEVRCTDDSGECRFPFGTAYLDADADAIRMRLVAADEDGLEQGRSVLESHLVRFAFREDIGRIEWSAA